MSVNNDTLKYDRATIGGPVTFVNVGSNASNQWFGRTGINSGTLGPTITISTGLVNSNSIIFFSVQNIAATGSANTAPVMAVASISPSGFFTVAAINSSTYVGSLTLMWAIFNPSP